MSEYIKYFDGLEIGTVSLKWCRLHASGKIENTVIRHEGNPRGKIEKTILSDDSSNVSTVITGHYTKRLVNSTYRPETECIERVLKEYEMNPDIVLSLGGESFVVYTLKNGLIKSIEASSKCAAGTGEFIIQQFKRMNYSLKEGLEASVKGKRIALATRCSVHCKSDATHKLNKRECQPHDIACSLVFDMAKKVSKLIELSKWQSKIVLLSGGLSLNNPFVAALKSIMPDSDIITIDESNFIEAFGASLIAKDLYQNNLTLPVIKFNETIELFFERLESLKKAEKLLDYRAKSKSPESLIDQGNYILGIDAGSTTTKAVLFNIETREIATNCYLRTNGNPVEATKLCLKDFIEKIDSHKINIVDIAVTGSGREVVSVFLDNCKTFNEILAHARAASEELSNVDTVFEIGGQDSKYVHLLNGIPVDYMMNEGCSAGTGSFLEESAAIDMCVPFDKISDMAVKSQNPVAFGERCAAFINTDLRNALQQGTSQYDVLAGLVYSIADNYISRVVNGRYIGDTIFFQGGVALNRAVALAIAMKTEKRVVVPPHPELMGCIGAAIMALDKGIENKSLNDYRLENFMNQKMKELRTFNCQSCKNRCEIKQISVNNKKYPFGGLCSKFENQRHGAKESKHFINLIDFRNELLFNKYGAVELKNPKGSIGIPMALSSYELFPFYVKIINELGYNVVLGNPTREGNIKNLAPICYPGELVHGAVFELLHDKNIDYVFLPNTLAMSRNPDFKNSFVCPTASIISNIVKSAFRNDENRIISPEFYLFSETGPLNIKEIIRIGKKLGSDEKKSINAYKTALMHYNKLNREFNLNSTEFLNNIDNEPVIVFAGRPYTIYADNVNLAIPQKVVSRGFNIIPFDSIPFISRKSYPENSWYFTQKLMNAVEFVKEHSNFYLCFISCFSCGPDASIFHEIKREMDSKPFCYLEIDSHTAHAGIETRLEAFLEIIIS